jgi:hypothetical protein
VSPKFKAKVGKVFNPPPSLRGMVGLLVPVMEFRLRAGENRAISF